MTNAEILALVRHQVQDAEEPYRHSNAKLLAFLTQGVADMRRHRPDWFLGALSAPLPVYSTDADLSATPPMHPDAHALLADYVSARVEFGDEESGQLTKGPAFDGRYLQGLSGR